MKGTEAFGLTIEQFLVQKSNYDLDFAKNYSKANKNLDECISYIIQEVKKSGCIGFDDKDIFDMAIKYYQDDSITVKIKASSARVVINHTSFNNLAPTPPIPNTKAVVKKKDNKQMTIFDVI